jgi:hypothetical protein
VRSISILCVAVLTAIPLSLSPASAQSKFATHVVAYAPGTSVSPSFADPTRALGGPQGLGPGSGSLDIVTLGVGGALTLGFDVTITDGPGADFTVYENGFMFGGGCFAEVAFVEVSTDGVRFARFPVHYAGPVGPLPAFGTSPLGTYAGLTGGAPGLANVVTNTISPFDCVVSGGEAFDLAALANDPLVVAGAVDLAAIHFVRIVDCVAGASPDANGALIWDHGGATGSADIDAVAVIQHAATQTGHGPRCDFELLPNGKLRWTLGDPDGLSDLDFATLAASWALGARPVTALLGPLSITSVSATDVVLESVVPIPGTGLKALLSTSVRDLSGALSCDQVALQG